MAALHPLLAVFHALPDATLLLSAALRIEAVSDSYLAATLTRRDTLLGQHVFEATPDNPATPEAHAVRNLRASLERVLATGQPHEMAQQRYDVPDPARPGQFVERHWLPRNTPVLDEQGRVQYILHRVSDVTPLVAGKARQAATTAALARSQQALLEAARRQAQERETFYQVFEQTPACIALLRGPAHRFEYVNPAYQQLFPGRQLVGLPVAEALPETVPTGYVAILDEVYHTGQTFYGTELLLPVAQPNGQPPQDVYFTFTYQVYREGEQVAGISIFSHDVTELVLARRQREVEREQLHQLFMEAPAPIVIFDGPQHVFQLVNPAYQRLFPSRELRGKPVLEALPELRGTSIETTMGGVYDTGTTFVAQEMPLQMARTPDGPLEDRYFTFTFQARRNAQGQVDGILMFGNEVTDQVQARRVVEEGGEQARQLAAELAATNEQLLRTNVDLDNFIYTASHDLKAPISNIEGLLHLLRQELPPDTLASAYVGPSLTRMLDAVERFKRTLDHLTEVSKLQKENAPVATSVDLAAVVEDVRLDLAPLIEQVGACLLVEVANLPAIQFSAKNLRSVVFNLLSNALKYRHPARTPHVDIRAHVQPGFTVLEVHDNGLGIPDVHQARLFGMFQRFHDHVEGTGIGLYMVKRMVDNAGGRVEVHSQLDAGTTVFIHLPQAPTPGV